MRLSTLPETALTAADEAAIADLLARCFGTDFGGRTFFHQRHHLRLLAHDPDLVGHMALAFRAVRLGGALVDVIGLAEVATDPGRRGQGIAGRLLERALAEARQTRAAYFLLFGDAGLYHAAGFRPVANPLTWVDLRGAATRRVRQGPADSLMVLPLAGQDWPDGAPLDLMGHLF